MRSLRERPCVVLLDARAAAMARCAGEILARVAPGCGVSGLGRRKVLGAEIKPRDGSTENTHTPKGLSLTHTDLQYLVTLSAFACEHEAGSRRPAYAINNEDHHHHNNNA